MTEPRAVIDVVGAEAGAHQLLEEISLLVRALGRAEARERLRTVAVANCLEAAGGAVKRLLPGRLAEMRPRIGGIDELVRHLGDAVLADHRLREALRIVHIVEAEAALDEEPVLVSRDDTAAHIRTLVCTAVVGDPARVAYC